MSSSLNWIAAPIYNQYGFLRQRGTHEYDRGHGPELDNHRLSQGVFPAIKLWVETPISQVVDVELPVSTAWH